MLKKGIFLASSTVASFITPFISTSVNIALPTIAKSFNISVAFVNWFVNVFLISMASTILFFGVVADWFGKERIFVAGVMIFAVTALLTPYINNFAYLLILRGIQGLGAAMISGTAVAILTSLFPKKIGFVIGINTTAVYVGTTLGPVLGGFLVDYAGWTSLFILSGTFALISFIFSLLFLSFTRKQGSKPPNFQSLFVFMGSIILVSVSFTYVSSIYGLMTMFLGLVLLMFALHIEYRRHLNLVKQIFERQVFLAYIVALLNYFATFALSILYSNYLQIKRSFTARGTGLILLAQPVPQALLSPLAGYLADKLNPGLLVTVGMGLIAFGIGLSIVSYKLLSFLIASLILIGIGFALFASPNTTQIMQKIPKDAFASATSFLGLMRFLGQSLSTSILTVTMLVFKTSTPMEITLTIYLIIALIGTIMAIMSVSRGRTNI